MIGGLNTIRWQRGLLKIRDYWYDNAEVKLDSDVVYLTQRKKPEGDEFYEQYTILIDLLKTTDEITESISKNCIEKIKRISKKQEFSYKLIEKPDQELLNNFILEYNKFAAWKKIAPVELLRFKEMHKQGLIMISMIIQNGQGPVCWHIYRVNTERVFLIYTFTTSYDSSDTTTKNNLGMVNRNCHYNDLLKFKELGIASYDFGGWYNGKTDNEKLNINKFKEAFGGVITENYNCIYYPTVKGKIFKAMKKAKQYAKGN